MKLSVSDLTRSIFPGWKSLCVKHTRLSTVDSNVLDNNRSFAFIVQGRWSHLRSSNSFGKLQTDRSSSKIVRSLSLGNLLRSTGRSVRCLAEKSKERKASLSRWKGQWWPTVRLYDTTRLVLLPVAYRFDAVHREVPRCFARLQDHEFPRPPAIQPTWEERLSSRDAC